MHQEIQPLFEVDAMKVAVGGTPDPEVAALPRRRQFSAPCKRRIMRAANACQVPGGAIAPGRAVRLPPHALAPGGGGQRTGLARPKRREPKPDPAKAESRRVEAGGRAAELGAGRADHRGPKKNYANCWGCPWARSPRDEQRHGDRPADRHCGRLPGARGGPCDVLPRAASGVGAPAPRPGARPRPGR